MSPPLYGCKPSVIRVYGMGRLPNSLIFLAFGLRFAYWPPRFAGPLSDSARLFFVFRCFAPRLIRGLAADF